MWGILKSRYTNVRIIIIIIIIQLYIINAINTNIFTDLSQLSC